MLIKSGLSYQGQVVEAEKAYTFNPLYNKDCSTNGNDRHNVGNKSTTLVFGINMHFLYLGHWY